MFCSCPVVMYFGLSFVLSCHLSVFWYIYQEYSWISYIWNVSCKFNDSIWSKCDKVFEYAFVFGYKEFQYKFIMAFENQKLESKKFYSMELE